MSAKIYDCIIVGAGPAGLGAALYASRDRFDTLVLEKFYPGGQIMNTEMIENYPGLANVGGADLVQKLYSQVEAFGPEFKMSAGVTSLEKLPDGNIKVVTTEDEFLSKVVILAPGSNYRHLGVPGEKKFRNSGAGVSYCGTCDAPFYRGKKVVAIGGGNTAIEEAMHLAKFADEVTLVHRRDEFRATKVLQEQFLKKCQEEGSNLKAKFDTVLESIEGGDRVEKAVLKNVKTGEVEDFGCDGVFIFVGMVPNTSFLTGSVDLTSDGFIKCDSAYLRTAIPGVFTAGDCRVGAAMQLITAVADGALSAMMMKQYFLDPKWWDESIADTLQPGQW